MFTGYKKNLDLNQEDNKQKKIALRGDPKEREKKYTT